VMVRFVGVATTVVAQVKSMRSRQAETDVNLSGERHPVYDEAGAN